MSNRPVRFRESFGAKIALACLGTVGVLLGATLVAVRTETARQSEAVRERATADFRRSFNEFIELEHRTLSRSLDPLARSIRVVAALEAALDSGADSLATLVDYERDLVQLEDLDLQVFTDAFGEPVLTRLDGEPLEGLDPVDVQSMIDRLFEEGLFEVVAFRVVEGRLFTVSLRPLEIGTRFVGAVAFGSEIGDAFAERVGGLVGGEICLAVDGGCIAGTEGVRGPLAELPAIAGDSGALAEIQGERWAVVTDPLNPDDDSEGLRIAAVPLEPFLAPLDRITAILWITGAGSMALALVLALGLGRRLAGPARRLAAAAAAVAEGKLDTTVEVTSGDELGRLAGAFNDMTAGLRLKEQYRGVLDKVVSRDVAEELLRGDVELGGENRRVTVLFADIRGFTPLTEGLPPQAVIELVNSCMSRLSDAVDRHGGIVDKYVGDELMAVFGAPISRGDDAKRALHAAMDMQREITKWNRQREAAGESPVGLGIGINTGEAVAGNMGSADRLNYTVLGESVNLAARLCSGAPAGAIWASGVTVDEADESVRMTPVGAKEFKGFSTDVDVYEVRSP